jgi:hypothetical protein
MILRRAPHRNSDAKEQVMTLDEMKTEAVTRIEVENPGCKGFKAARVYDHIMDGIVVLVAFMNAEGKDDSNCVYFGRGEVRNYRWVSDVLQAVSATRERNWFFRFIELAGVGGVIASFLVLVFSILLFTLALVKPDNSTILEVVKLSFTLILGFFFGSQAANKKTS